MTTDDGITGRSRISIGIHVVDERVAERRGNVETGTYTARCLHADLALPPEKLADEPYTNMNKPARLSPGKSPGLVVTPGDRRPG